MKSDTDLGPLPGELDTVCCMGSPVVEEKAGYRGIQPLIGC